MPYHTQFRFKAIEPRRFYDTCSLTYLASVFAVVGVQLVLLVSGKPGLRSFLGL